MNCELDETNRRLHTTPSQLAIPSQNSTPPCAEPLGVMCGDVKCFFEFCVYDYKGRLTPGEEDDASCDNCSTINV